MKIVLSIGGFCVKCILKVCLLSSIYTRVSRNAFDLVDVS